MALLGVVGRQLVPRLAPWCVASSTSMVQGAPWGSSKVQGATALRHLHLSPSSPSANPSDVKSGFGPWDDKVAVAGTGALFHWPSYNERVHTPDGTYRPAYICHMRDNVKYTQKKMWHMANFVRGLSVDEALKQLQFINKKGALVAAEVISEARELALAEHCVEFGSNLWVAESFATKGMRQKGMRRHGRMRMATINYDYMHYYVRLEEGRPPRDYWGTYIRPFNAHAMLEDWVAEHRQRRPGMD